MAKKSSKPVRSNLKHKPKPATTLASATSLPEFVETTAAASTLTPGTLAAGGIVYEPPIVPTEAVPGAVREIAALSANVQPKLFRTTATAERLCVIEGDSWFNYPLLGAVGIDLVLRQRHGYSFFRKRFSHFGDTLENMAFGSWSEVLGAVRDSQARVLLLSAGGNDLAGDQFLAYVRHHGFGQSPLWEDALQVAFTTSFEPCIRKICTDVQSVSPQTKVFMHGYDHAIPDGRGIWMLKQIGPWLQPSFEIKGWSWQNDSDRQATTAAVARMIDMLNELIIRLAGTLPNLVHVELRDIVKNTAGAEWANELHLNNAGFAACADKIAETVYNNVPNW